MTEIVWGNFTQEELDRNYDQSSLVPNVGELMEQNAADSSKIRENLEVVTDISYGPTVMERLDFFRPLRKADWSRFIIMAVLDPLRQSECSYVAPV